MAGDLLHTTVDAIVNSEQTDFILALNPDTLSGAIRKAWGPLVQGDLDAQTRRRVLPLGSLLVTRGGLGGTILHVGLHAPDALDEKQAPDTAAYLPVVRRAVRDALELAAARGLRSIAFPLLGCGLFGLDPALVAYEMFGEVAAFAEDSDPTRPLDVRVVVRSPEQVPSVVAAGVQAWIDRFPVGSARPALDLGVPWIDLYEAHHVVCNRHPQWSSWTLARLAELVVGYIAATSALAAGRSNGPTACFAAGRPVAFGTLREITLRHARAAWVARDPWPVFLRERFAVAEKRGHLRRLNEDRNDLAHGRAHRPYEQMRADLEAMLDLPAWKGMVVRAGPPDTVLDAWTATHPSPPARVDFARPGALIGVAEAWSASGLDYVVPWAGLRFRMRPPK